MNTPFVRKDGNYDWDGDDDDARVGEAVENTEKHGNERGGEGGR